MNPRTIIRTYFAITGLFNLAMSLIWGIDTLFKMGAGLDVQPVLLTNAAFTLGSMVFEVPTGVVADTVGRRVSLLLCLVTLFVTTLLYVAIAWRGWGFWAFAWVSVLLGLGYTFYTGAVDAWLVDALKASGYDEPLERVFSRGQMLFGAAMLVGTIGGACWARFGSTSRTWCGPLSSCRCSCWLGAACPSSDSRRGLWSSSGCRPSCGACSSKACGMA